MNLMKMPLSTRFNHLLHVIASDRFLKKQGLGNEVPFFICPFKPEEQVAMYEIIDKLRAQLTQRSITVLTINLYDLCIELLHQRELWNRILQEEPNYSKEMFKELLQGVLDIEHYVVPAIHAKLQSADFDVFFLTGIGEVFPYIRSHTVLNNLQKIASNRPMVMFFPGDYTFSAEYGSTLELFGRLHDDKYYRAFNIFHYEVPNASH